MIKTSKKQKREQNPLKIQKIVTKFAKLRINRIKFAKLHEKEQKYESI